MYTITTKSLDDFFDRLKQLEAAKHEQATTVSSMYVSPLLFRGQADSAWTLKTTLERYTTSQFTQERYHNTLAWIRRVVETALSSSVPAADTQQSPEEYGPPPGYEFMIYTRHHGFPSPLLDWTRSPYIALYFAFEPAADQTNEYVAVYVYREHVGQGKGGCVSDPHIVTLGPTVRTHRRHFTQQCEYTICQRNEGTTKIYCCHDDAFASDQQDQDLLWKFLIPRTERMKMMEQLDRMNITEYALFGTEEALLKTIAERTFRIEET